MRALILLAAALAAGCAKAPARPDLPGPGSAVKPDLVTIDRIVYVKVPAALTRAEPIAEGPIAQCFDVAAQRRAALERANAKLRQIAQLQGTQVTP